jgi:hypothetical protein
MIDAGHDSVKTREKAMSKYALYVPLEAKPARRRR